MTLSVSQGEKKEEKWMENHKYIDTQVLMSLLKVRSEEVMYALLYSASGVLLFSQDNCCG